jgi:hypothetical protein
MKFTREVSFNGLSKTVPFLIANENSFQHEISMNFITKTYINSRTFLINMHKTPQNHKIQLKLLFFFMAPMENDKIINTNSRSL